MRRLRRAVVHIGGEKTGSSTLQAWCARNRTVLARQGFLYSRVLGERTHLRLAAHATDDAVIDDIRLFLGVTSPALVATFRRRLTALLEAEVADAPDAQVLLLSNEHLQSRLRSVEEVARLKAFIDMFAERVMVLVYLRRQDRVAASYYSTRLKADIDDPDEVFPGDGPGEAEVADYYDYDAMLRRYEAIFGQAAIRVRILEPARLVDGDLVADFQAQCAIEPGGDLGEVEWQNRSLSPLGLAFYRRFNKAAPRFVDGKLNADRAGVKEAMALFAGEGPIVAGGSARAFLGRFAHGNAAIRARYFPGAEGPLFAEDFGSAAPPAGGAGDERSAMDVAVHLWLERTRSLQILQAENALFRYLLAGKAQRDKTPLPPAPPPGERGLPEPLLLRYAGALLEADEPARAAAVLAFAAGSNSGRPALTFALALALLRAGDATAYDALVDRRQGDAALLRSLAAVRAAGGAMMTWPGLVEQLRLGDAIQAQAYRKCLKWLED